MKAIKYITMIAVAMATFTSCNLKSNLKKVSQSIKVSHEYRDSKKWGKVVQLDVSTDTITSIQAYGNVEVQYTQGDIYSLQQLGNEKALLEYKFIHEPDGQLIVMPKDYNESGKTNINTQNTPAITIIVTAPYLTSVKVLGSGDIFFADSIEMNNDLNIEISGAGNVDITTLSVDNFSILINGAGDVDIEKAQCNGNADFRVNGAGDIDAKIRCKNTKVVVNGAGNIDLDVKCNRIIAECNGAGDIELEGECKQLIKKDGPIGGIDSRDLKITGKTIIE